MAAPYDLQPLYDTSPTNSTPSSMLPMPINMQSMAVPSTHLQVFTPNSSEHPCVPTHPVAVPTTPQLPATYAEELQGSSPAAAHVMPKDPVSLDADSRPYATTTMLNHQMLDCCDHVVSKPPAPATKLKINSPFSLITMHDMFTRFDTEKRALLESIGLGGLLKVHKQRLHCRNLLLSLLSSMDATSGTITLKRGQLSIQDRDVNHVLGIPYRGEEVNLSSRCPSVIDKVKTILLIDSETDITNEVVDGILSRDYGRKMNRQERDAFKVAAMLFVDSCFLGPRGCKRKINKDILKHVAEPQNISRTNWSRYVLRVLQHSALKVQQNLRDGNKSVLLEGCLLFLLVFYLDNLEFGYMTPPHDIVPRIGKYTPSIVSELVSYDRRRNGCSKIRPRDEVVYSRFPTEPAALNQALSMKKHMYPETSSRSNMKVQNLIILPQQNREHTEMNMFEVREALHEYMQVFRNQIHQCTDELERKVQKLLNNFDETVCLSSLSPTGVTNDAGSNSEQLSGTMSKLGLKVPSRKYYMTVKSSSISNSNNHTCSELAKIDMENLLFECLTPGLEGNFSGCPNKSVPPVMVDESNPDLSSPIDSCLLNDPSQLTGQSMFVPSPFVMKLNHKDVPLRTVMAMIRVLPKLTSNEKEMLWYIHDAPTKIVIGGESLYLAFYKETDFSLDIMVCLMRLYQELDDEMYQGCCENRWRHYLPPDWAFHALKENGTTELKKYFVGNHISYQVANCIMVFVPVHVDSHWSLYAWDFHANRITIMDPLSNYSDILYAKHDSTVALLHKAMLSCREEFFGCSDLHNTSWDRHYLTEKDDCSSMSKSGLYTAFYARFFDGATCSRSMVTEDSVTLFQTSLLCLLLGSVANKGTYPNRIRDAIKNSG